MQSASGGSVSAPTAGGTDAERIRYSELLGELRTLIPGAGVVRRSAR